MLYIGATAKRSSISTGTRRRCWCCQPSSPRRRPSRRCPLRLRRKSCPSRSGGEARGAEDQRAQAGAEAGEAHPDGGQAGAAGDERSQAGSDPRAATQVGAGRCCHARARQQVQALHRACAPGPDLRSQAQSQRQRAGHRGCHRQRVWQYEGTGDRPPRSARFDRNWRWNQVWQQRRKTRRSSGLGRCS